MSRRALSDGVSQLSPSAGLAAEAAFQDRALSSGGKAEAVPQHPAQSPLSPPGTEGRDVLPAKWR